MNAAQYEELCRYFVAQKLKISPDRIESPRVPQPTRPGLPKYYHQIDLLWEWDDDLGHYLNIANAKWRRSQKVDQGDVLLLNEVKQQCDAQKAFLFTNVGFTEGAQAVAKSKGIALHVVAPSFEASALPMRGRSAIQATLQQLASQSAEPIFRYDPVYRAYDLLEGQTSSPTPGAVPAPRYSTRVVRDYPTKAPLVKTREVKRVIPGQGETPGGGGSTGAGSGRARGERKGGSGKIERRG